MTDSVGACVNPAELDPDDLIAYVADAAEPEVAHHLRRCAACRTEVAGAELWRLISSVLKNETEQILMHLTLEIGLKPREIQAQRPDLFADVKAVYTLTRNIYDRLGRGAALRRWYEERGR
jgi:hypothetical protein